MHRFSAIAFASTVLLFTCGNCDVSLGNGVLPTPSLESPVPVSRSDVLIMTRSTLLGTVAQWLQAFLTVMCDGNDAAALKFFSCLKTDTEIPKLWAAMGLNSTMIQVQTIQTTAIIDQNATVDANSLLTLLNSNVSQLQDLLTMVVAQLPQFCLNVDHLYGCMEPFSTNCLTREVQGQMNAVANSLNMGHDNSSDVSDNESTFGGRNNESFSRLRRDPASANLDPASLGELTIESIHPGMFEADNFTSDNNMFPGNETSDFGGSVRTSKWMKSNLPLLESPREAIQLLHDGLEMLCLNDSERLTSVVKNLPCMFKALGNMSCDAQINSFESLQRANSPTNSSALCSAAVDVGWCYIVDFEKSCGGTNPELTHTLVHLGQMYLHATECRVT